MSDARLAFIQGLYCETRLIGEGHQNFGESLLWRLELLLSREFGQSEVGAH